MAEVEASAIAASFADGLIEASVCNICDVAADIIVESFESIFVNAATQAEIFLEGASTQGNSPIVADPTDMAMKIVSSSATAFAKVRTSTKQLQLYVAG